MQIDYDRILNDQVYRHEVTYRSHAHFFGVYLSEHGKCPSAEMHHELFRMTESQEIFSIVMAFRGSGKSTIGSFSFPMWAMLGHLEKKFIVLVSKTQEQAHRMLDNIRTEFEQNKLLCNDFGVAHEENSPWNTRALRFNNCNAMIATASTEQAIRGMKFGAHRPDLIIFDDIEERNALKSKDGRDALSEKVMEDFIPAGSPDCRYLFIGSNLHADSVLNRFMAKTTAGTLDAGIYFYPIAKDDGTPMWPGLYKDAAAIEAKRRQVPDARAWKQEYELIHLNPANQIIQQSHIQYYDAKNLPSSFTLVIGIDPAIGTASHHDYTGIVPIAITGSRNTRKMYVLPDVINERMDFPDTIKKIVQIQNKYKGRAQHLVIESVAYQKALAQQIKTSTRARVHPFVPQGSKEDRIWTASSYIMDGSVKFLNAEHLTLVSQLVGFGTEKYDDLADALSSTLITIESAPINGTSAISMASLGISEEEWMAEQAFREKKLEDHTAYMRVMAKQKMAQGLTINDMGDFFLYLSEEDKQAMYRK